MAGFTDFLNSDMYKKDKPSAMPLIEKLINFKWSSGRKMQRESAKCFSKLAESNDMISNRFLKEVDGFCTTLKEKYIDKDKITLNLPQNMEQ